MYNGLQATTKVESRVVGQVDVGVCLLWICSKIVDQRSRAHDRSSQDQVHLWCRCHSCTLCVSPIYRMSTLYALAKLLILSDLHATRLSVVAGHRLQEQKQAAFAPSRDRKIVLISAYAQTRSLTEITSLVCNIHAERQRYLPK